MARPGPAPITFGKRNRKKNRAVKKEVYSYSKKMVQGAKKRKSLAKAARAKKRRRAVSQKKRLINRKRLCLLTPKIVLPPRVKLEPYDSTADPPLRDKTLQHLYSAYYEDSDFPLKWKKQDFDFEYQSQKPLPKPSSSLPVTVKTEQEHKVIIEKLETESRIEKAKRIRATEEKSPIFKKCLKIIEKEWLSSCDRRVMTPSSLMKLAQCSYAVARRAFIKFRKEKGIKDSGFPDWLKQNLGNQLVKNWGRSGRAFYTLKESWDKLASLNVIEADPVNKERQEDLFLKNLGAGSVVSPAKKISSFNLYYKNSFNILTPLNERTGKYEDLKPLKALKFSEISSSRSASWLLNTGSPITNISWCPLRDNSWGKRSYLAISGDAYEIYHGYNTTTCAPWDHGKEQVIQIWELSTCTDVPPRSIVVITHRFGFCDDLQWCPFITNYYVSSSGQKMLGVIVFTACGKIYVLDVPAPKTKGKFSILEAKPREVLEMTNIFFWKISFGQPYHRTYLLAVGSREGYITMWDFRDMSSPLQRIQTSHGSVTAIAFHTEDKYIIAAGTRSGELELFDTRNLFGSWITRHMFSTPIVNLHFIPGTETLMVSSFHGKRHMGVKLFSMIQNAAPQFNSIYVFDLENNHPWGLDCVVLKRKDEVDLITAISTSSGHTLLYKHPLKALFIGRKNDKRKLCLSCRILQSWTKVEEIKDGPASFTVGGPEPTIAAPNTSGESVKKFGKTKGSVTDIRVVKRAEAKDLANMNQVTINRQLVDGTFMLASGGIAGIVHIFQAKGDLM